MAAVFLPLRVVRELALLHAQRRMGHARSVAQQRILTAGIDKLRLLALPELPEQLLVALQGQLFIAPQAPANGQHLHRGLVLPVLGAWLLLTRLGKRQDATWRRRGW